MNRIILDNNGMGDREFSGVLEGLGRLHEVKSIIYNHNEFGMNSAIAMCPLIKSKMMPYHLEEIRLNNCKMGVKALSTVLDCLLEKNFIKKLGLVNAQLNSDTCMAKLCELVNGSRYLFELDISWNGLRNQ